MTGMRKLKEEAGEELFPGSHDEPKTNFPCKNTLTTPDLKRFIVRGLKPLLKVPSKPSPPLRRTPLSLQSPHSRKSWTPPVPAKRFAARTTLDCNFRR